MHLASASVFAGMLEEALGAGKRSSPIWASRELNGQGGSGAAPPGPNAEGMIVYSEEYVTREMPMSLLKSWITPAEHFFVRNNEHMPEVNLADWKLSVTGEVARPLTLTMDELARIEPRSVTNALECAGNGRAFFQPRIKGVPWARGGVGNAVFKGPPLGALLRLAGAKSAARHVAFRGVALPSRDPQFIRSIPIDKAMDPDTIVATEMNGLPLAPEHGYPARALVPGWIGSASIKWLTEIRVMTHEFEGYYMDSAYRLPSHATRIWCEGLCRFGSVSARVGDYFAAREVSDRHARGRFHNPVGSAAGAHFWRCLGGHGNGCARGCFDRRRHVLATGGAGLRARAVCVAALGFPMEGAQGRETTSSFHAPLTAEVAASRWRCNGIPRGICGMRWTAFGLTSQGRARFR